MTLDQIKEAAAEKWKILPEDCRTTRAIKNFCRDEMVKKLRKQYGHDGPDNPNLNHAR